MHAQNVIEWLSFYHPLVFATPGRLSGKRSHPEETWVVGQGAIREPEEDESGKVDLLERACHHDFFAEHRPTPDDHCFDYMAVTNVIFYKKKVKQSAQIEA